MLAAGSTVPLSVIAYDITAERPVELRARSRTSLPSAPRVKPEPPAADNRQHAPPRNLIKRLLRRVWRLSSGTGLVARTIGRGLVFFYFIVYEAAGETRDRADTGTESSIAGDSADDCTTPRADGCAGERPLLGRVHVGAAGQR